MGAERGQRIGEDFLEEGFPDSSVGKESPAMQENFHPWVGKDPLEKGKATTSSILAWRIPWTVLSMGSQRVRHD